LSRTGALAAAVLLSATAAAADRSERVTVKGSDTLVVLVQRWAEAFMHHQPRARVQVTGGGTGTGIASLLNGTTDIAMASRAMTPEERAELQERTQQAPVEWIVAQDAVTFYVNAQNPVEALSLDQLRRLYVGELTHWSALGGMDHRVSLYSRESSSGTYAFVKERLLNEADFAVEAQTLPGTAAVVSAVSHEPWAIGYGGAAFTKGVKELRIKLPGGKEMAPTQENIRHGQYPLSRDLFFYTRGEPKGAARAFLEFARSPEGQRWVLELGYYPAR
jgi:phosphate transport system substrate-binding protein